ncbi:MAG: hypothetical protein M3459_12605 [Actinomycetota bacterium]|nr:hypothetical protein [Actinomycetota bacterium]
MSVTRAPAPHGSKLTSTSALVVGEGQATGGLPRGDATHLASRAGGDVVHVKQPAAQVGFEADRGGARDVRERGGVDAIPRVDLACEDIEGDVGLRRWS